MTITATFHCDTCAAATDGSRQVVLRPLTEAPSEEPTTEELSTGSTLTLKLLPGSEAIADFTAGGLYTVTIEAAVG